MSSTPLLRCWAIERAVGRHPRALLPAAARGPLAQRGRRRAARGAVPRLEPAYRAGVLPRGRRGAAVCPRRQDHADRQYLGLHQLQLRPDAARVAGAADAVDLCPVLDADRQSRERHGGHGNAIAMPYHHAILPLSSRRDKVTEVRWGIADFRRRFGRDPEGMWLPET